MAQQTAMQQLIQWMKDNGNVIPFDQGDCYNEAIELLQMEKEQIIDAWQDAYLTGCVVGSNDYTNENEETDNGAYYYNQTYNQNK